MPEERAAVGGDGQRESDSAFIRARQKHSAVESALNDLEQFGLDRCPDHGIIGFKRYVVLAVLVRNLHRLGGVVRERETRAKPAKAFQPQAMRESGLRISTSGFTETDGRGASTASAEPGVLTAGTGANPRIGEIEADFHP